MLVFTTALSILKENDVKNFPAVALLLQKLMMQKIEEQSVRRKILKCLLSIKFMIAVDTIGESDKGGGNYDFEKLDTVLAFKDEFMKELRPWEVNGLHQHVDEIKNKIRTNMSKLRILAQTPVAKDTCINEFNEAVEDVTWCTGNSFIKELPTTFNSALTSNISVPSSSSMSCMKSQENSTPTPNNKSTSVKQTSTTNASDNCHVLSESSGIESDAECTVSESPSNKSEECHQEVSDSAHVDEDGGNPIGDSSYGVLSSNPTASNSRHTVSESSHIESNAGCTVSESTCIKSEECHHEISESPHIDEDRGNPTGDSSYGVLSSNHTASNSRHTASESSHIESNGGCIVSESTCIKSEECHQDISESPHIDEDRGNPTGDSSYGVLSSNPAASKSRCAVSESSHVESNAGCIVSESTCIKSEESQQEVSESAHVDEGKENSTENSCHEVLSSTRTALKSRRGVSESNRQTTKSKHTRGRREASNNTVTSLEEPNDYSSSQNKKASFNSPRTSKVYSGKEASSTFTKDDHVASCVKPPKKRRKKQSTLFTPKRKKRINMKSVQQKDNTPTPSPKCRASSSRKFSSHITISSDDEDSEMETLRYGLTSDDFSPMQSFLADESGPYATTNNNNDFIDPQDECDEDQAQIMKYSTAMLDSTISAIETSSLRDSPSEDFDVWSMRRGAAGRRSREDCREKFTRNEVSTPARDMSRDSSNGQVKGHGVSTSTRDWYEGHSKGKLSKNAISTPARDGVRKRRKDGAGATPLRLTESPMSNYGTNVLSSSTPYSSPKLSRKGKKPQGSSRDLRRRERDSLESSPASLPSTPPQQQQQQRRPKKSPMATYINKNWKHRGKTIRYIRRAGNKLLSNENSGSTPLKQKQRSSPSKARSQSGSDSASVSKRIKKSAKSHKYNTRGSPSSAMASSGASRDGKSARNKSLIIIHNESDINNDVNNLSLSGITLGKQKLPSSHRRSLVIKNISHACRIEVNLDDSLRLAISGSDDSLDEIEISDY
eukprot:gene18609-20485_t